MTFFYDLNKKLAEINDKPTPKQLNEGAKGNISEISDKTMTSLAQKRAAQSYDQMSPATKRKDVMTHLSNVAKPHERSMAKQQQPQPTEEGIIGTIGHTLGKGIKKAGKAVGKALVGPSDQELAADLQDRMYPDLKKVGKAAMKPPTKPLPMAKPRTPIAKEEYGPLEETDMEEGNDFTGARLAAIKAGKPTFTVGGKTYKVTGDTSDEKAMDESALQAYLGKKKYGKEGMQALQKAGREGASEKTMDRIRDQHDKMDEGWDDMMKDVEKRHGQMKKGEKKQGHKGEIEKTDHGIKHTRRYDDKTGETDVGDDEDKSKGEKRKGRPKGSGKKMGAKGPSGKSKLITKEAEQDSAELKRAMAMLKKAGYKVTKTEEELDETEMGFAKVEKAVAKNPKVKNPAAVAAAIGRKKYGQKEMTRRSVAGRKDEAEELDEKAVSQQQQKFMGMVHAMQKGEKVKGASPELKKVARTMKPKDAEDFAKTKHKGLPKKKTEEVEETAEEKPKASKGGMTFGKGIYDSMNRELEQMIAESMNISMNMSDGEHGGPSKSLTVTATDEDALYLGKLLKMAGVGGESGGCGCGQSPCGCNSADQVDENAPDWPTDEVESEDALQYAGGLNKPKTTVAGDGQTTVPVTAVQVREGEEELDEQEQVVGMEAKEEELDEELQRIREMAGIKEAAKPDYIDLDKDGNKKESMKKAAADAEKDKKVEESILNMTNLWKAYKG